MTLCCAGGRGTVHRVPEAPRQPLSQGVHALLLAAVDRKIDGRRPDRRRHRIRARVHVAVAARQVVADEGSAQDLGVGEDLPPESDHVAERRFGDLREGRLHMLVQRGIGEAFLLIGIGRFRLRPVDPVR